MPKSAFEMEKMYRWASQDIEAAETLLASFEWIADDFAKAGYDVEALKATLTANAAKNWRQSHRLQVVQ